MTRVSSPIRVLLLSVLALCVFFTALPTNTHAAGPQEMRLKSFRLMEADGALMLTFGVDFSNIDQMKGVLKEGVKIELLCDATLSRSRSFWFRKTLATNTLSSLLYYDTLTREYYLTLPGNKAPHRNKSLKKLLDGAWASLTLPVASTTLIAPGDEYRVSLSIESVNTEIPEWLAKSFFFWSWDPAPPIHYSTDFTY